MLVINPCGQKQRERFIVSALHLLFKLHLMREKFPLNLKEYNLAETCEAKRKFATFNLLQLCRYHTK